MAYYINLNDKNVTNWTQDLKYFGIKITPLNK